MDDIDFSPITLARVEESLGELIAVIRARRGRVLITSQKPLPQRLRHAFNVLSSQVIEIPRLSNDEIREGLAIKLGCPGDHRKTKWSRLVDVTTGGHPQLVAVSWRLRDRAWPN